jgi:phospholipase/carboxylesterase
MTTKIENFLPSVEIEPNGPATASIIWLHGLGADGNDFAPMVPAFKLPTHLAVRFIFPHAPIIPVTINNGANMPAWFDITALNAHAKIDEEGITKSVQAVGKLIAREQARGIATNRIIVSGFSQGAVISLFTTLSYPAALGGAIALSGYLPLADKFITTTASTANQHTPIFMAHGTGDTVVPYMFGKISYEVLAKAGYPITWHSYAMPHSVCPEEIMDISQWIQKVLSA